MTIAQGVNKLTVIKAQTALGTPATGSGGQELRRVTSVATQARATYTNNEIVAHQQSTGVNLGTASTTWAFDGLLSPGTYASLIEAAMREDFAAITPATGLSLTIAGSGPYTLTDAANDFLADGIKIGDVIRITAGSVAAGNLNNNMVVTNVTATVVTVVTLNGSALTAEGPIASCTITVVGKKSKAPLTSHTDTIFTLEEWYPDITVSETFPDMRVGQFDFGLPATGNATIKIAGMGLGVRTIGASQVLTTPTAATTTPVLTAVRGLLRVNGSTVTNVTGVTITVNPTLTAEGPIVGSNYSPDLSRGKIMVTGQFTALFDASTLSSLFDAETVTSLFVAMAADTTNAADFISFSMSAIKLTGDAPNDGEIGVVRTYPFTAQINADGGAALANDQTILTVQDSQA